MTPSPLALTLHMHRVPRFGLIWNFIRKPAKALTTKVPTSAKFSATLMVQMFADTCEKYHAIVEKFLASDGGALRRKTQDKVQESLAVLEDALTRYG